eukprot:11436516-Heterocapsa_arctica.AAC.1
MGRQGLPRCESGDRNEQDAAAHTHILDISKASETSDTQTTNEIHPQVHSIRRRQMLRQEGAEGGRGRADA